MRRRRARQCVKLNSCKAAIGGIGAQLLWYFDGAVAAVQQDDIGAREVAFDDADQFVAIQVRKLAVQDDDAGTAALQHAQSLGSGAGVLHESGLAQGVAEALAQKLCQAWRSEWLRHHGVRE